MQQEKRHAVRKRMDQLLYAELGPNNGSIVVDLSEQGCGFQAIAPIHDRELHFILAIGGGHEIQGTGRVTWLGKTKKAGGLRFINLSDDLQEQIRTWLNDPRAVDVSTPPLIATAAASETGAESEVKLRRKRLREEARRQWQAAQQQHEGQQEHERQPGHESQQRHSNWELGDAGREFQPRTLEAPSRGNGEAFTESAPRQASGLWRGVAAIVLGAAIGSLLVMYHREVGRALIWLGTALSEGTEESQPTPGMKAGALWTQPVPDGGRVSAGKLTQAAQTNQSSSLSEQRGPSAPVPATATDSYSAEVQALWRQVENGDTRAEVALADRYITGDGVPKSCGQAKVLLQAALKRGNPDAQRKLEGLRPAGCP